MIALEGVSKVYRTDRIETLALDGVSLTLGAGRVRLDHGAVGVRQEHAPQPDRAAGRALDGARARSTARRWRPTATGSVARLRNEKIGFIFQSFHLIADLTVLDNVELPLLYRSMSAARAQAARARRARTGRPRRRASSTSPASSPAGSSSASRSPGRSSASRRMLLADEPTGNLDSQMGDEVMAMLHGINRDAGTTMVMVTHDARLADATDRIVRMFDGRQVQ